MTPYKLDQFQANLRQKQQCVTELLAETPLAKQQCCLGKAETEAVEAHLHIVTAALEQVENETIGLCQVCHGYVDSELLEIDYTAHVCLDHFSPAERRALEYELELSQVVQKGLLPQQAPNVPGLEVAVFSQPSHIIGGDFFDFFNFQDGALGLAIADVAGHGVSASLIMASLQTALRTLAPLYDQPAELVSHLNRFFIHNIHFTSFVTLFVGRLEPGSNLLHYSNAGHNPPLLHCAQANGTPPLTWLRTTGPAIGLVEGFSHQTRTAAIHPGDLLVLYTDGVTETMNGDRELFGEERLADLVQQQAHQPARELVQALRNELTLFTNDQPFADDLTIVVSRFDHHLPEISFS